MVVLKDNQAGPEHELRKFGVSLGAGLTLIGAIWLWRGSQYYWCFFMAAGLLVAAALAKPVLLRPLRYALVRIATALASVVSFLVLAVFYYLILTPFAVVLRLKRPNVLETEPESSRDSYWIERKTGKPARDSYERQF